MSRIGERTIASLEEAVSIAKGDIPAARLTTNGHTYVPLAEYERLHAAVLWALGEAPDDNGLHFGDDANERTTAARYWWRKTLRRMAGMGALRYDKERRTIVNDQQNAGASDGK